LIVITYPSPFYSPFPKPLGRGKEVRKKGVIVEMEQSPLYPTYNPHESDRIEELIVNPIVLEITRRRGNIDMNGIRYVVIRYGTQYQLLMPYKEGHIYIGVELDDDPRDIERKVAEHLNLPI
jgi:hypothetical protein